MQEEIVYIPTGKNRKILGPKLDLSIKIKVTNHTSCMEYKRCVGT